MTLNNQELFIKEINKYQQTLKGDALILSSMKNNLLKIQQSGLPTQKDEDWKYTKMANILTQNFKIDDKEVIEYQTNILDYITKDNYNLVFVDGTFIDSHSKMLDSIRINKIKPEEEILFDITKYLNDPDIFFQLNTAALKEIIVIDIISETNLVTPLNILNIITDQANNRYINPNIIVRAGTNVTASIYNKFKYIGVNSPSYFLNSSICFDINRNSKIEFIQTNENSDNASSVNYLRSNVKRDSTFTPYIFNLKGKFNRNNIYIDLSEENAIANISGAYTLQNDEHCDTFVSIKHISPNTFSRQYFKGVLNDYSKGFFTGNVIIPPDSHGVIAEQTNKNLLLSSNAYVNSRPLLEIFNDDVKCSHGSTIGDINAEEVFYLMSRGIEKQKAKNIIYHAFIREIVEKIESHSIRKKTSDLVTNYFNRYASLNIQNDDYKCLHGTANFI